MSINFDFTHSECPTPLLSGVSKGSRPPSTSFFNAALRPPNTCVMSFPSLATVIHRPFRLRDILPSVICSTFASLNSTVN